MESVLVSAGGLGIVQRAYLSVNRTCFSWGVSTAFSFPFNEDGATFPLPFDEDGPGPGPDSVTELSLVTGLDLVTEPDLVTESAASCQEETQTGGSWGIERFVETDLFLNDFIVAFLLFLRAET